MKELDKYIVNLKNEMQQYGNFFLSECTPEEELMFLYSFYHYFGADCSKIDEIEDGMVFNSNVSDLITGIYIDEDSDNNDVDVVLVYRDCGSFDVSLLLKALKDAETLAVSSVDSKNSIHPEMHGILSREEYKLTANRMMKIVLLTDFNTKSAANKKSLMTALTALKPINTNVSFAIVFGYDIEHEILEIENPKEYVDSACIKIDKPGNVLSYGKEESLIVNASAASIKEMYELYNYRGLFAQNLRYYVKNAKVDDNIVESMLNKADNFWYYNNGVIIVCDDYKIIGNEITVNNFSVINGGQTTKLIGETDFAKDFYVQCKIVKNKYIEMEERLDFIADVAEASNTQKPIKDKDLIANKTEQRLLKRQLSEAGIYCQIKRGEKVNKKLYPYPWQNTTNEELGQFLLSFSYQKPGTARSNKASICANKERYSLIYGKKYSSDFLGDLLKIKAYYKLWMQYTKKTDDGLDSYKLGLVNNGMLYVTSIIGAVAKYYYHTDYASLINSAVMTEQKMEIISQHDIDHHVFKEFDNEKEVMFSLFEYCYRRFYRSGYEFLKTFKEKYNNYSNFTKVNSNYSSYVFKQISYEFRNGIPQDDKEFLDDIFYSASKEELDADADLLKKYVNVVFVDLNAESSVPDEKVEQIKEALINYRTKTYKLHRVKAYEVFKNAACERIAKFAPGTVEELGELRCLDAAQLKLYGEDIVDIVNSIINS